ncbi:MAG: T9SS type A sorting domain-containing protein, partial [Bacteroidales bacterium]|nr:T9SS type A sorting domain-containing protein [Bacteroidales bacterium]
WNSSAPSYHIEYGIRGFSTGTGTSITATGNNVTLTDLLEDQAYDVYVYAICAEGIMSIASQKHTFETTQENINITGDVSLRIYPNPTINATTSTLKGVSGEVTVTVVDMNGRVVKSETMWCNDDCTLLIDVKNLALGDYLIRFSCENLSIVRKLIVK